MSFGDYLSGKAVPLCAGGMAGLYLLLTAYLCGLPLELLLLLLASGIFAGLVIALPDWRRVNRRLSALKKLLDALPEKYLIGETLPRPGDPVELEYFSMMKEISRSAIAAVEQARAEKADYCGYVEQWVHEIKTPLTACSLILANGGDPAKLRRELRRADNLTESILTYAKLPSAEKDTHITRADLGALCARALREEMELLIAADIRVSVEGAGNVYTDDKLLVFILKQLLINCAKYCPGCAITIRLSPECLCFEDNGPGIPDYELPRVTDRGFTGAAGRKQGSSTGMGLYIVKELCEKLNNRLEIASEEGSFTRFTLHFPT